MGMDGNAEFVFDNRSRTSFLEQFPGIYTSSAPVQPAARSMSISREAAPPPAMKPASHQLCPSVDIPEQLLVGDWDPLMSSAHHHPSFTAGLLHSQGVHCSSVGLVDEQIRAIPCFSSTGCPEVISSYTSTSSGLPSVHAGRADLLISGDHQVARDSKRKKRTLQESTGFDSYPQMNKMQNTDDDDDDDDSEHLKGGLPDAAEKDDKKLKSEEKPGAGSRKANAKHGGKEQPATNSEGKQDYIHVRAKRGQATNSHSLAERVRREKISERMRYLQNLVPGCNKITGKAVMLDEIINYVQSLQRQVEFLSMKLATVNPELNFDIDQILSKDMLHLRRGSSSSLGFGLALNSSQHLANGYLPPQLLHPELMMTNMTGSEELLKHVLPHIPPFAQTQGLWDHELQNAIQMGFLPNISVGTELPSNNQEHHNAKM